MLNKERWPFIPERLSDIIEPEILSVIAAGCCERVGRSLTILDAAPEQALVSRVDAVNPRQNFEPFCAYFRHADHFEGGNEACERCDLQMARSAVGNSEEHPHQRHLCHMGLSDSSYTLKVRGYTVGVLLCGQWRPNQGIAQIREKVRSLGTTPTPTLRPLHKNAQTRLLQLADHLPSETADFVSKLEQAAQLIEHFAETNYQHKKSAWEAEFLNYLRNLRPVDEASDLRQISQRTTALLQEIQRYCHCDSIVLFANQQSDETVLIPLANVGLPASIQNNLPHFNWRKAGLSLEASNHLTQELISDATVLVRGLRGGNNSYFHKQSCAVAQTLGQGYRAVMLFGRFAEPVDLEREKAFLFHLNRIINWSVHTEIQMLHLRSKRKEQENLTALITHQVRTALTPISTHVGTAKILAQTPPNENGARLMRNALKGAHELSLRLGSSVAETVKSSVLLQERDDMKFEPYPLSVLVANCAEGFVGEAAQRQRQLIIHESIEYLPTAEVDIARLTIAISNLLDNALKYSYPNTRMIVRAAVHGDTSLDFEHAMIEIQNDGDEIPTDKRDRIFEQGQRGLTGAKLQRIPGSGLGLWEARSVIEAHGGRISVKCDGLSFFYRQQQAFRVIFTLVIPLKQSQ